MALRDELASLSAASRVKERDKYFLMLRFFAVHDMSRTAMPSYDRCMPSIPRRQAYGESAPNSFFRFFSRRR